MTRQSAYLLLQCQYRIFMAVLLDDKRDNTQDDKQVPESLILPTYSFSFRTFLFKMAYTTQFMDSWFGIEIYRVVLTV